nr:MAG TPA: hypothetical protein [Caudoviricetes sp.]DAT62965.1 MAG TPA: hypothetical protein [Caudoviricetes sp.]
METCVVFIILFESTTQLIAYYEVGFQLHISC